MTIEKLNNLSEKEAVEELMKCCGSLSWANKMRRRMPFEDVDECMFYADRAWYDCADDAIYEAFGAHPKIGNADSLAKKYANTQTWVENEQSGVNNADTETLKKLVIKNKEYEEKFKYIFIVFATGKSAKEMLEILESRIPNNPKDELKIAAEEQSELYKKFAPLSTLTTGGESSTGIGLFIASWMAKNIGGSIEYANDNKSVFTLILPRLSMA